MLKIFYMRQATMVKKKKKQCTQIIKLLKKLFSGKSRTISFYVSFFISIFFLSVSKVPNGHCCVTKAFAVSPLV